MKKLKLHRASLEVFGGCNYSCSMCPQSTGRGSAWTRKMPMDLFENILQQLDGNPLIELEGSGEPFLAKDLPEYINRCKSYGFKTYIKTNGSTSKQSLKAAADAGLDFIRFSVLGYNKHSYLKNMGQDNWYKVLDNIDYIKDYIDTSLYHLVLDNHHNEIDIYKKIAQKYNVKSYVWKTHNWSGNLNINLRKGMKRSCGRPFANDITIRAGGEQALGAVVSCSNTLGPPNETKSVMGYASNQSLYDIFYNEKYNHLRDMHRQGKFDAIDYCKNCDFLIEDTEVLVWTNDNKTRLGHFLGTDYALGDNNETA